MSRKDHKEGLRESIRRQIGDLKRDMATSLAKALEADPEAMARLQELGLVDPSTLSESTDDMDMNTIIRNFGAGLAQLVREEPSVMHRLDIRPLDVMATEDGPQVSADDDLVQITRSVVFSDLEGFTAFNQDRGDLEAGALLRDHYDVVEAVVRSRGGVVVKTLGDGHMLSFTEPAAAIMATADLLAAAPHPLRLRAGGHCGQVLRAEDDLLGHVVNVAARVTDLADGGAALVTTELRDRAGRVPGLTFSAERSETLTGIEELVDVCEVRAA